MALDPSNSSNLEQLALKGLSVTSLLAIILLLAPGCLIAQAAPTPGPGQAGC